MATIPVTEARAKLRDVIKLAKAGEDVYLTQHGEVVAVVVSPEGLRARRTTPVTAQADDLLARLHTSRERGGQLPGKGLSRQRADSLIANVRADRDAR